MAHYVLLSNLTDEGWKTVKEKPDRIREVNKEMQAMGIKVLSQHACLGPYDFLSIVEAADNTTIAKASLELGARGTVRILTVPLISIDDFIASLKKK